MMITESYSKFRDSIRKNILNGPLGFAEWAFLPADLAVLMGRAMASPDIDTKTKGLLIMAGLYTSAGIELIPESLLGPIGLVDDGIVIISALNELLNESDQRVIQDLWEGSPENLYKIQSFIWNIHSRTTLYIVRPFATWLRNSLAQVIATKV